IVGGDVGFRRRSTMPSRSSRRRRVVSIFAETPLRSVRSSEKQRSSSRRYQITSAVHAPLSNPMQSFSGHWEGGGSTLVLRRLTTKPSYQTVTRFWRADGGMPDRIRLKSICTTMNSKHKQTAVITGASSGIGLGLTRGFLEAGFNVV